MGRGVLVLAVLVVVLGLMVHREPLPDGFQHPYRMKPLLLLGRGVSRVAELVDWLGWARKVIVLRHAYDKSAAVLGRLHSTSVTTREMEFAGVPVRLYVPASYKADGHDQSAIVFYHGGGWCIGSPDSHGSTTKYLAEHTPALVISVQYRLAPEHLCPAAFDDCLAATKHFLQHAQDYGVSPDKVALMGDSAGGTLAAGVALALRDAHFSPQPAAQVLIYPAVQKIDLKTPSFQQNAYGTFMDLTMVHMFLSNYAVGSMELVPYLTNNSHVDPAVRKEMAETFIRHADLPKGNRYAPYSPPDLSIGDSKIWDRIKSHFLNPYQAPLLANSLADLPPAYVFTCQFDVLRDEGFMYARRLELDGNRVEHFNLDIGFHGLITFVNEVPETRDALDRMITFLRKVYKEGKSDVKVIGQAKEVKGKVEKKEKIADKKGEGKPLGTNVNEKKGNKDVKDKVEQKEKVPDKKDEVKTSGTNVNEKKEKKEVKDKVEQKEKVPDKKKEVKTSGKNVNKEKENKEVKDKVEQKGKIPNKKEEEGKMQGTNINKGKANLEGQADDKQNANAPVKDKKGEKKNADVKVEEKKDVDDTQGNKQWKEQAAKDKDRETEKQMIQKNNREKSEKLKVGSKETKDKQEKRKEEKDAKVQGKDKKQGQKKTKV